MQTNPLVSIIIPAFNAVKYLEQTIESVLNQTYGNIEIIIIDNNSTDDTYEIAKKISKPNFIVTKCLKKGASSARNVGLKLAKGQFIQFLDADDLLPPNKIECQLACLKYLDTKIALSNTIYFTNNNINNFIANDIFFLFETHSGFEFLLHLYGYNARNSGGMFALNSYLTPRKIIEAAGLWNENLTYNDDGEFFCRVILAASDGVVVCKDTFAFYRKETDSNSLSKLNTVAKFQSALESYILIFNQLKKVAPNDPRIEIVVAKMVSELCINAYPQYLSIYRQCLCFLDSINQSLNVHKIGGDKIQFINHVLGWKTARYLSFTYNKYFKQFESHKK